MTKKDISNYAYKKRSWEKKRRWIYDFKLSNPCCRCGFKHPAALQFHHKNGKVDKRDDVVNLVNNGVCLQTLINEVNKCVVLCANCHSIFHFKPRFPSLPQGTLDLDDANYYTPSSSVPPSLSTNASLYPVLSPNEIHREPN